MEGEIIVVFTGEGTAFDRTFPLDSWQVAPVGTYTQNDWREELQEGSLLDAFDNDGYWRASTVLAVKEEENDNGTVSKLFRIAFRVFTDISRMNDPRANYSGISRTFDEWLSKNSPRLAAYQSYSKEWPVPLPHYKEEACIVDTNDSSL